jgi:hypothetical protein
VTRYIRDSANTAKFFLPTFLSSSISDLRQRRQKNELGACSLELEVWSLRFGALKLQSCVFSLDINANIHSRASIGFSACSYVNRPALYIRHGFIWEACGQLSRPYRLIFASGNACISHCEETEKEANAILFPGSSPSLPRILLGATACSYDRWHVILRKVHHVGQLLTLRVRCLRPGPVWRGKGRRGPH